MNEGLAEQVGEAAVYVIKAGGGTGLLAVKQMMIVLLGIEAGGAGDGRDAYWLQLEATKHDGKMLVATVLVDNPRLTPSHAPGTTVLRYIYQEGDARPIEYVNAIRGGAMTTPFGLLDNFFPSYQADSIKDRLFPNAGIYLGLPIELIERHEVKRAPPANPLRLDLDPELLVGTGRNTRDVEGQRIWSGEDYTYRRFDEADYDEMINAGMNYFWVDAEQEEVIWRRPVFYLKWAGQNLQFPEMFYRANCRGMTMFMDEPAIHMGWYFERHAEVAAAFKGPAGAARLLEARIREDYETGRYGRHRMQGGLARQFTLGSLSLSENDYPAWETQEWSAYYQLKAGLPGMVHEGRYTNQADVNVINAEYDVRIPETPTNNFRIRYAWFRGAARAFEGDWGTAIYGQCERSIARQAVTDAYDMGARYVWFWTSDQLHHVPYPEQVQLTRHLRDHEKSHPRRPLDVLRKSATTAIVLPDGYVMSAYMMWGHPAFHLDRVNEQGMRYRDVLHPAALQVERCIRQGISFDFLYNDGGDAWMEYDESVVIDERGAARWYRKGVYHGAPPVPARPADQREQDPPVIRIGARRTDDPRKVMLAARIDNNGEPVGLRTRDWGTPDWAWLEAFWFIYEDPDIPRFAIGREIEHRFDRPGSYRVMAWTCNTDGIAARAERHVVIE